MIVGMLMVLLFLLLMIYCIQLIEALTRGHTRLEEETIRKQQMKKPDKTEPGEEPMIPAAVLAAAVAAYEADRNRVAIP